MKSTNYNTNEKNNQKGISNIAVIIIILVVIVVGAVGLGFFAGNNEPVQEQTGNQTTGNVENNENGDSEELHVHDYTKVVKQTEATCSNPASTILGCECGAEKTVTDTITLGHHWTKTEITKQPTATEEGEIKYMCSRCDATMVDVLPATGDGEISE